MVLADTIADTLQQEGKDNIECH